MYGKNVGKRPDIFEDIAKDVLGAIIQNVTESVE